jgi:hypothetical protein
MSFKRLDMATSLRTRASGLSRFELPFSIFMNIPSKGSGFLLHATILTLLPSSHGSMAV